MSFHQKVEEWMIHLVQEATNKHDKYQDQLNTSHPKIAESSLAFQSHRIETENKFQRNVVMSVHQNLKRPS